jgi:hypothetical protein
VNNRMMWLGKLIVIPGYGGGSGHLAPGHVETSLQPAVIGRQRIVRVCQLLDLRNNYIALQTKKEPVLGSRSARIRIKLARLDLDPD